MSPCTHSDTPYSVLFEDHDYPKRDCHYYIKNDGNEDQLKALAEDLNWEDEDPTIRLYKPEFTLDCTNTVKEFEVCGRVGADVHDKFVHQVMLDGKLRWTERIEDELRVQAALSLFDQLGDSDMAAFEGLFLDGSGVFDKKDGDTLYVKIWDAFDDDSFVFVRWEGNEEELRKMQADLEKAEHNYWLKMDLEKRTPGYILGLDPYNKQMIWTLEINPFVVFNETFHYSKAIQNELQNWRLYLVYQVLNNGGIEKFFEENPNSSQ